MKRLLLKSWFWIILAVNAHTLSATAIEAAEKACNGGDARGCAMLGLLYEYGGQGVKQDYGKARTYYDQACNGGEAWGCFNLGVFYVKGQGVKQDYGKAKTYYGRACDLKEQRGCDYYKSLNQAGH